MNKEFDAGTALSHYRILSKIGKGGMGEVYLAEDTKLDRRVALKILPAEFAEDQDRMSRFVREAKSASALNHPNIITIHDIGESGGSHFIATEFIEGKTLNEFAKNNPLDHKTALDIAIQVASALDEAHQAGIVHRDIKPDNIMVRENGLAKILDFGIAKLSGRGDAETRGRGEEAATLIAASPRPPDPASQSTTPGMIIGTPNYMSPEQARGKDVDHQTDIFSFGVVFYEMLSGSSPFAGETVSDVIASVLTKEPKSLTGIPAELADIVNKTLQKDKKKRYETTKELFENLKAAKQELEINRRLERTSQSDPEEPKTQILKAVTDERSTDSTIDPKEGFRVAVLPFKYRGTNTDLESLAEGLSEEIVTGLSRFSYLRVIARGSTLSYESEGGDVRSIGKALGARYVMEGTLRLVGTTFRLSVQLLDAETGEHLWAETFDRAFHPESIFELQDELVPQIVSTVADWYGVLPHSMSEAVRIKSPEQLTGYEAVLRSFGYFERINPEEHAAVREGLERAVNQEPGNADAWAMLSMIYGEEHRFAFNVKPDSLGRSLEAARRAVDAAHANHFAWLALAQALFFRKEFDAFRDAAERAVALNPLDGAVQEYAGHLISFSDDWERGTALSERALHLNPNHPGWYWTVFILDAYRRGDYEAGRGFAVKCALRGGGAPAYTQALLAALYGQMGDKAAAAQCVKKINEIDPSFPSLVEEAFAKWYLPELVEDLMEGLRKAGLKTSIPTDQKETKTQITEPNTTVEENSQSIAVLPFTSLSSDEDNEYFCDGLAEELLNALSKIENLKVAARTSAFSFKGKNANVSEIGEKLAVRNVLEGSVRRSGDKLRISVRLENATDGFQVWSESYDREMKDIFEVQDEIALAVVEALKLKLLGGEKESVTKRFTNNAEAYQLYLRGRYLFARRTVDDMRKAIGYFERALKTDPEYALAFVGIADVYNSWAKSLMFPPNDSIPQAMSAAKKALEIDPLLADAHASLADSLAIYDWNWEEAEREFKRAIELNPNVSFIHFTYGISYLVPMGRMDEAVAELTRAVELEPLSLILNSILAEVYLFARKYDKALDQARIAFNLNPNFGTARFWLGHALLANGMVEEAIELCEDGLQNSPANLVFLYIAGQSYARSGNRQKTEQIIEQISEESKTKYVQSYSVARIYTELGDKDKAFAELEEALEQRDWWLPRLKTDPLMDSLRGDPRFNELLKKIGLPPNETTPTNGSIEANTLMLQTSSVDRVSAQSTQETGRKSTSNGSETEPPDGVGDSAERQSRSAHRAAKPQGVGNKLIVVVGIAALLLTIVGYFGYEYVMPTKQIESIAVMPFVNESGNADVEYLSDGMTETLISSLSQLPNLNVKPRSSVFRYKGKETDPQTIAKELNVQAILNGRVVQRGDDISLFVELIDIGLDKVVWSETYNRKQTDLVSLQSEIARDVSGKIKTKLSGEDIAKVTKTYTANPEAYQLYLKGNFYTSKYTDESWKKGIEYYEKAIAIDPNYALAYHGIAVAYDFSNGYYLPPKESEPKAKAAALKALELDETLAETHYLLGKILFWYEWDWPAAERETKRANQLDPTFPAKYPVYLASIGNYEEAIKMQEAVQLRFPLDLVVNLDLATILLSAGRIDRSIEQTRKSLELDPNFWWSHQVLGLAYARKKQYPEAIEALEKARRIDVNNATIAGYLGYVYAAAGKKAEAQKVLGELKELSKQRYVSPYSMVCIYAGLGDKDQAFDWLERTYQERSYFMTLLKMENVLDTLRPDPRFKDLLKRMNLPE